LDVDRQATVTGSGRALADGHLGMPRMLTDPADRCRCLLNGPDEQAPGRTGWALPARPDQRR
jgi:hypothetical protein